jgi:hypothetical protein
VTNRGIIAGMKTTTPPMTADERDAVARGWVLDDYRWARQNPAKVAAIVARLGLGSSPASRAASPAAVVPATPDLHTLIRANAGLPPLPPPWMPPTVGPARAARRLAEAFRACATIPPTPSLHDRVRAARGRR